jgi:hypothetical protein
MKSAHNIVFLRMKKTLVKFKVVTYQLDTRICDLESNYCLYHNWVLRWRLEVCSSPFCTFHCIFCALSHFFLVYIYCHSVRDKEYILIYVCV